MIYSDMNTHQSFDLLRQVARTGKKECLSRDTILEAAAAFKGSGRIQHSKVGLSKPRIFYSGNRIIHTTKD
jgi:hypothetical protein